MAGENDDHQRPDAAGQARGGGRESPPQTWRHNTRAGGHLVTNPIHMAPEQFPIWLAGFIAAIGGGPPTTDEWIQILDQLAVIHDISLTDSGPPHLRARDVATGRDS